MTLFILDPSLENVHGHHMQWNMSIAASVRAREQDVTIFANKVFPVVGIEGAEIVPWFSHTCYAELHPDRVSGKYDDFRLLNDELLAELSLIPRDRFRATDVVLAPTITEKHLLGYVSWMKTFDPAIAPLFIIHLMFPSGLGAQDAKGQLSVSDPQQALFYKLAFRVADAPGPRIHFFGGGRQLAREFSELMGTAIEPHPIPNCPIRRTAAPGTRDRSAALLFAGDAKADKGFLLVPPLGRQLATRYPDWDFIAHANAGAAWGEALQAFDELVKLGEELPNVRVQSGRLTRDEYLELMEAADCYICSYDPVVYARKSSGVVWESVSLAMPVLAPADTWLDYEPKEWGAGHLGYTDYSVDGIIAAFETFRAQLPELYGRSAAAAERYHAYNSPDALMNQIGALWAPRLLAASLTAMPQSRALPIERFEAGWHFVEQMDGAAVRWTNKEFTIRFEWPFVTGWEVELEVINAIATEQITGVRALVGDTPVSTLANLADFASKHGALVVSGPGPGRNEPEVELRVVLPWTYKPEDDGRDLGVLIRRVQLVPGRNQPADTAAAFEIATEVERSADGRAFRLASVVSGYARLDPAAAATLRFTIRTDRPELARAVRLFVNAVPLALDVAAAGDDVWDAAATCSPSLLSRRGYRAEWDLQLQAEEPDAAVWIADLALPTHASAAAASAEEPAAAVDNEAPAEPAAAPPARSAGQPVPAALDDARMNEHYVGSRTYAHLDVSLFGLSAAGEFWAEVRFKFCAAHNRNYLEFRNLSGWPQVFSFWQFTPTDQFGPLVQIGGMHPMPEQATRREILLVQAIASVLPRAVESILRRIDAPSPELRDWADRANHAAADWADMSPARLTAEAA